jgi:hypothetical protein
MPRNLLQGMRSLLDLGREGDVQKIILHTFEDASRIKAAHIKPRRPVIVLTDAGGP